LASHLVIIYGPALAGKSSVAWRLARMLAGKSAVVSFDGLLGGSIANRGQDEVAELQMVHTQARLLVANYMKNGYHVVVEGSFFYEVNGEMQRYEQEIDQLVALMRQMTERALLVHLTAPPQIIEARAKATWREDELAEALQIAGLYKERLGTTALTLDSGAAGIDELARAINDRIEA
jgi:chloramphenicol 3-O-phosphotransferase